MRVLGRARQEKGRAYYDGDVNLPAFLNAKSLLPFVDKDLYVTSSQIEFKPLKGSKALGYPAELLPNVCEKLTHYRAISGIDADFAQSFPDGPCMPTNVSRSA